MQASKGHASSACQPGLWYVCDGGWLVSVDTYINEVQPAADARDEASLGLSADGQH